MTAELLVMKFHDKTSGSRLISGDESMIHQWFFTDPMISMGWKIPMEIPVDSLATSWGLLNGPWTPDFSWSLTRRAQYYSSSFWEKIRERTNECVWKSSIYIYIYRVYPSFLAICARIIMMKQWLEWGILTNTSQNSPSWAWYSTTWQLCHWIFAG